MKVDEETKKYLQEVKERESRATEGPWFWGNVDGKWGLKISKFLEDKILESIHNSDIRPAYDAKHDLSFIAFSRTDIPSLLKIIESQEVAIKIMAAALNRCRALSNSWVIVEKTIDCKHTYAQIDMEVQNCFKEIEGIK